MFLSFRNVKREWGDKIWEVEGKGRGRLFQVSFVSRRRGGEMGGWEGKKRRMEREEIAHGGEEGKVILIIFHYD
jgi:hypothetical protein